MLGFFISAILQALVSKDRMRQALGRDRVKEIALASILGAESSSYSYASAAISLVLERGARIIDMHATTPIPVFGQTLRT